MSNTLLHDDAEIQPISVAVAVAAKSDTAQGQTTNNFKNFYQVIFPNGLYLIKSSILKKVIPFNVQVPHR